MWNWISRLLAAPRHTIDARVDSPARNDPATPPPGWPTQPALTARTTPGELRQDWQSWLAAAMRSTNGRPLDPDEAATALDALPSIRLPALDQALRRGSWRAHYPTRHAKDDGLRVPGHSQVEAGAFLFVHACAPSGFVRQRALEALPGHPGRLALAAALIRADDWVAEVRDVAVRTLRDLLADRGDDLFALLPLVEALRRRERFAAVAWPALVEPVLLDPRRASARWLATQSADGKTRATAFSLVTRADPARRGEACLRAIADPDPSIARWALGEAAATGAGGELARIGLRHRSGSIRAESLRRLVAEDVADLRGVLERALFDDSAAARDVAVYWLRERHGVDARAAWRGALDAGVEPGAGIALQALGDRAEAIDAERVRPYLHAPVVRARLAALKACAAAQPDDLADLLARALLDPSPRVVATALELARRSAGGLDVDALRAAFAVNAGARRRLLAVVPCIDQWRGLQLLLDWLPAAIDDRDAIASRLRYWILATQFRAVPLPASLRDPLRSSLARARAVPVGVDWRRLEELLAS